MSWAVRADWSRELKLHWSLFYITHYQDDADLASKHRGNQLVTNGLQLPETEAAQKWSWRRKKNTEETWWKHISFSVYKTGTICVSSQVLSSFNAAFTLFKSLLCGKTSSQLAECWDFRHSNPLWWAAATVRKVLMFRQVQAHLLWAIQSGTSMSAQPSSFSQSLKSKLTRLSCPSCQWALWPQSRLTEPREGELQQPDWQSSLVPVGQQHTQPHGQSRAGIGEWETLVQHSNFSHQAFPGFPDHGSGLPHCSSHAAPLTQKLRMLRF